MMNIWHLTALSLLAIAAWSCSNSEYAEGFSQESFDEIGVGDTVEVVLSKVGEPLRVVHYPIDENGVTSTPEKVALTEALGDNRGRSFVFRYSLQKNQRASYWRYFLTVKNNQVVEKSGEYVYE